MIIEMLRRILVAPRPDDDPDAEVPGERPDAVPGARRDLGPGGWRGFSAAQIAAYSEAFRVERLAMLARRAQEGDPMRR